MSRDAARCLLGGKISVNVMFGVMATFERTGLDARAVTTAVGCIAVFGMLASLTGELVGRPAKTKHLHNCAAWGSLPTRARLRISLRHSECSGVGGWLGREYVKPRH